MWTEYTKDARAVEGKLWPRGLAVAQVLWTGAGDFDDFLNTVTQYQLPRLVALGITPGRAFPEGWTPDGHPPWHATHSLREIRVRTGDLVDQIDMCYWDGSVARHGNNRSAEGGSPESPFVLTDGEALVRIEAFQAASLYGCQFFLDSGRASPFYGRAAGDCTRFEAEAGQSVSFLGRWASSCAL